MIQLSSEMNTQINKIDPYLLILSYEYLALIVPIMFSVLLADFPKNANSGLFPIVRMGRREWLLGEILYALLAGITYLIFLLVGCIIVMGKTGEFSNKWSHYMTIFYRNHPEIYEENNQLFIHAGTVTQGTPLFVLIQSSILMLLNILLLSLIQMTFKLIGKKILGLFSVIVITIFGTVGVTYFGNAKWIFPMAHAIFGVHYNEFLSKPECSLITSYFYFGILILVMLALNLILVKKIRIGDDSD